jgi:hypothetical protein
MSNPWPSNPRVFWDFAVSLLKSLTSEFKYWDCFLGWGGNVLIVDI